MPKTNPRSFENLFQTPEYFGNECGTMYAISRIAHPAVEDVKSAFEGEILPEEWEKARVEEGYVRFGFMPEREGLEAGDPCWYGPVQQSKGTKPVWFVYID